ncbi:MAG: caspase family protein [Henriciella sp.]
MRYFIAFILSLALSFAADAQTKRAFIVGVQNYDELTDLTKTLADAEGYADVFENELGFEVTLLRDPNFSDFLVALSDFEATIETGDEIVFVFSGHGWSDGARNFVAMSDAPLRSTEVVLERLTFDLNEAIINKFRAKDPSLVLAIVDACRDNPFDLGTKSVTKGLVPQQTIPGTLVVYAAGASQQALDRLDPEDPSPYSVFTRTLLPKLENAETPLMRAFDEARSETAALASQISHLQRPAIYSDISLDFCFALQCASGDANAIPDIAAQREAFLATYHASHTTGEDAYGFEKEMFPVDAIKILQETDLDGDGYLDYYVTIEHIFFCGSGGCLHEVVLHEDGNYRPVYQSNGGNLVFLETRHNGVKDLAREFGFTYERMSVYELMRYDGTEYQIGAALVCSFLTTYCGLSDIFAGNNVEGDSDQRMVFYPVDDPEALSARIDAGTIYDGLESAFAEKPDEMAGSSYDVIRGIDASNTYVLVDIWKASHGVVRLPPTSEAQP